MKPNAKRAFSDYSQTNAPCEAEIKQFPVKARQPRLADQQLARQKQMLADNLAGIGQTDTSKSQATQASYPFYVGGVLPEAATQKDLRARAEKQAKEPVQGEALFSSAFLHLR